LREIVEETILKDILPPESPIPSIRLLSKDYQVNPITVSKAIDELVHSGVLYKKRGIGMFVSEKAKEKIRELQYESYKNGLLIPLIEKAKMLGYTKKEITEILNDIYGGNND